MVTPIAKLREIHASEMNALKMSMQFVVRDPVTIATVKHTVTTTTAKKMIIDSEKLERTIQKAKSKAETMKKKPIVVLDKNPVVPASAQTTTPPVAIRICQARNINGTPCKCKATKLGKFCAKHAP